MGYKLFLDDIRNPEDCFSYVRAFGISPDAYLGEWVVVRSFDEFRSHILNNGRPYLISFDHDLGREHYNEAMSKKDGSYDELYDTFIEKTGYDAAKWFVQYCNEMGFPVPTCVCHSMNPVGRQNINNLFKQKI
jgi:hypothetical protein